MVRPIGVVFIIEINHTRVIIFCTHGLYRLGAACKVLEPCEKARYMSKAVGKFLCVPANGYLHIVIIRKVHIVKSHVQGSWHAQQNCLTQDKSRSISWHSAEYRSGRVFSMTARGGAIEPTYVRPYVPCPYRCRPVPTR